MTYEELKQYQKLRHEIIALQAEKESLYFPVKSPSSNGAHSSTPGDPTKQAFDRIQVIDQKISDKLSEYTDRIERIEEWANGIDDNDVKSIVRLHFLANKTWNETAVLLSDGLTGDTCRKKFKRYFKA